MKRVYTLNESQFRRLVRNEVRRLAEDVGDDIENMFKGGPAAVRSGVNSAKDKEALKAALGGDYDGVKDDDVVKIAYGENAAVKDLKPTQSEIDLVKSIGWPLCSKDILKQMLKSGTSTAPGSITVSGNLILDGHHRWSGIWAVSGAQGMVSVDDIGLPGEQAEKLASSQLAIAAYKKPSAPLPAASDPIDLNILGKSSDEIEQMILDAEGQKDPKAPATVLNDQFVKDCSNDPIISMWARFEMGADPDTVKTALAKRMAKNLSTLPQNPSAPARADMPQFDHDDIGGRKAKEAIFAGLQSGEFNVRPPFKSGGTQGSKQSQTSGYVPHGAVMIERWQRLAGIIKG